MTQLRQLQLTVHPATDSSQARELVKLLQNRLNSTGTIRAASSRALDASADMLFEDKSEVMLLYTLALAFVQTGAAKSLIETIRAALSAAKDKQTVIELKVRDKSFTMTNHSLSENEIKKLVAAIEKELASHERG